MTATKNSLDMTCLRLDLLSYLAMLLIRRKGTLELRSGRASSTEARGAKEYRSHRVLLMTSQRSRSVRLTRY